MKIKVYYTQIHEKEFEVDDKFLPLKEENAYLMKDYSHLIEELEVLSQNQIEGSICSIETASGEIIAEY